MYILSTLHLVSLLFIFYALGKVVQEYFSFKKSNMYISMPVGMFSYFLVTQAFYMPLILLGFNIDIISIIETVKAVAILSIIIVSFEKWMPKFSLFDLKTTGYLSATVAITLGTYFLLVTYIDFFGGVNTIWLEDIARIGSTSIYGVTDGSTTSIIQDAINRYQSEYYWIYISASKLVQVDQVPKIASVVNLEEITFFVRYEFTIIWLLAVNLTVAGIIINHERNVFSWMYSTIVTLLVTILLAIPGATTDDFYSMAISIIIITFVLDYSSQRRPSDTIITLALIASIAYITIGSDTLYYLIVFGLISVLISAIRGGSMIRNSFHFLLINFAIFMWYVSFVTVTNLEFVGSTFLYMIGLILVFTMVLYPIYSLGYNSSRRLDLNTFENRTFNRVGYSIPLITALFTGGIIVIEFLGGNNSLSKYDEFFIATNIFGDGVLVGIIVYILLIAIPTIAILVLWHYGYRNNSLLTLFALMNLIMNPVVSTFMVDITKIPLSTELVLLPSLFIISGYAVMLIKNSIKKLH